MTATGTVEIFNVSHTGYSIKVSGASVDGGFKGMFFPTWSKKEYSSEEWKRSQTEMIYSGIVA